VQNVSHISVFLNGIGRQGLKPKSFAHVGTYLQQKKIQGRKP
jgi:hypothetical protein